jgi:hypothetical protein
MPELEPSSPPQTTGGVADGDDDGGELGEEGEPIDGDGAAAHSHSPAQSEIDEVGGLSA